MDEEGSGVALQNKMATQVSRVPVEEVVCPWVSVHGSLGNVLGTS